MKKPVYVLVFLLLSKLCFQYVDISISTTNRISPSLFKNVRRLTKRFLSKLHLSFGNNRIFEFTCSITDNIKHTHIVAGNSPVILIE